MARLVFHGHAAVEIVTGEGLTLLVDPWLDGNPQADIGVGDVARADYIFCTHGHGDHFSDVVTLARQTGATVVGTFEIADFVQTKGVENTHAMSIGGGHTFPFGRAKMTPALHGGQVAGDEAGTHTTMPAGFLFDIDGKRVYHAGDTALMMDMQLLRGQVDIALLPIGDNFTMGPEDAVRAVEFIEPAVVIPIHYDTFDVIRQDARAFARGVGERAEVVILEPGGTYEF
jgi:L-ascorbate metabolism protein UlaG (beta-lactamase superfamily)